MSASLFIFFSSHVGRQKADGWSVTDLNGCLLSVHTPLRDRGRSGPFQLYMKCPMEHATLRLRNN